MADAPCKLCGDSEPHHVHGLTVGRGQSDMQAALSWHRRAVRERERRQAAEERERKLREAIEEYRLWEPGRSGHAEAHRKLMEAAER